jgi:hypothetical protein
VFTTTTLITHQVWDEVIWSATAVWDDGSGAEPARLSVSGRAPAGDDDSPIGLLTAALQAMRLQHLARDSRDRTC